MAGLTKAHERACKYQTIDALTGKMMGRPPSATLRTMDVVGIDTFAHVAKNVYDYAEDPYRDWFFHHNGLPYRKRAPGPENRLEVLT